MRIKELRSSKKYPSYIILEAEPEHELKIDPSQSKIPTKLFIAEFRKVTTS
jgi:hypothetical protein